VVFVSMGAMILVSLAVPDAFGDDAFLFALTYLVVRLAHLGLFWVASAEHESVHRAVVRLLPTALAGPLLLIAAGFADGALQGGIWALALAIDYGGPAVRGVEGYTVHPAHFAERFGLIMIIALGESIVAIGIGAAELEIDLGVGVAAVLGIGVAAALWWAYFDVVAPVAQRRLTEARGGARNRMARDSYAYLHLPMIAGIVLFALAMKKTLEHVGDPLETIPAVALGGGIALYLLAHVAFRLRNVGTVNRQRLVAAALCAASVPVAREVPALAALAIVAAICAGLIAFEAIHHRAARSRVRLATP
jgi:low temperature requirement protein LtrA